MRLSASELLADAGEQPRGGDAVVADERGEPRHLEVAAAEVLALCVVVAAVDAVSVAVAGKSAGYASLSDNLRHDGEEAQLSVERVLLVGTGAAHG